MAPHSLSPRYNVFRASIMLTIFGFSRCSFLGRRPVADACLLKAKNEFPAVRPHPHICSNKLPTTTSYARSLHPSPPACFLQVDL
ncbi:hypothetical protein DFP73DRAFT_556022 [Morchella snyderi]|nr:hypothetical protein DFP73DRAFT_556022 [Morchella snyderi]